MITAYQSCHALFLLGVIIAVISSCTAIISENRQMDYDKWSKRANDIIYAAEIARFLEPTQGEELLLAIPEDEDYEQDFSEPD